MKQFGQYSTLNDASSCQLASVWKNTPTQCNSSIPRTRSWPWSTLYCAGVLYTCHLNICSPWIWTNKLDHSDTSKLHRVNSLMWIITSFIGTKCWQTSIQHQSPNQTKPSAPHQDNQSIEISQTTHIYMHTHTHTHSYTGTAWCRNRLACWMWSCIFPQTPAQFVKAQGWKYQCNGGEQGTFITLLHTVRAQMFC